jgi:predicted component of type VI protein secretion system
VIQAEGRPNTTLSLEYDEITFGRDPRNDLVLDDTEISRQHGRFIQTEDGCFVEDLASLNGTYVNGKRLSPNQPRRLYDGDTISLSQTLALTYRERDVEPDAPIAPPNSPDYSSEAQVETESPAVDPRMVYSPPPPEPTPWALPDPVVPAPVSDPLMPEAPAYVMPEGEPFAPDAPPSSTNRLVLALALLGCLLISVCLALMAALVFFLQRQGIL